MTPYSGKLKMQTQRLSGSWIDDTLGTDWVAKSRVNGLVTLSSRSFSDPVRGILLARECILDVPGKFFAETLLVYPQTDEIFPIFGSEYIRMARGCFGAVDFHPVQTENNLIPPDFDHFPPRTVPRSPHYDLDRHFSPVLWHHKSPDDFYGEFSDTASTRLRHYLGVLPHTPPSDPPNPERFSSFDTYMALNDPARGILRAHFSAEFADEYIRRFLFPHGRCDSELGHFHADQTGGN